MGKCTSGENSKLHGYQYINRNSLYVFFDKSKGSNGEFAASMFTVKMHNSPYTDVSVSSISTNSSNGYSGCSDTGLTNGTRVTLNLGSNLEYDTLYDVTISNLCRDNNGLSLGNYRYRNDFTFTFRTPQQDTHYSDTTPVVTYTLGTSNVSYEANLGIIFDRPMKESEVSTFLDNLNGGAYVDDSDNVYVVGTTSSADYPVTVGAYQNTPGSSFVTKLNRDLTGLGASTYFGGTSGDSINDVAVNSHGQVTLAGKTKSSAFPVTSGVFQQISGGATDGFVAVMTGSLTEATDAGAPTWPAGKLTASDITQTSLTLSWSGSLDDMGVTGYRLYTYQGSGMDTLLAATDVTEAGYEVTGLNAGAPYTFKVEACDAVGNWSTDGPVLTVTTAAEGDDTTAPTWPEGSALTVSDKSQTGLTLSWTSASDDLAVDAYQVYKDGALLDTVYGATTYNVTGLNPGTEYTFKVEAGDAAGNWTTVGLSATATTDNASVNVSLVLDKSSAGIGGKVTASGTADPNKWVTIEVLDSGQNIVVFDGVKSDAEGNYSVTFLVPDSAKGTLTIVAGYGSNVATASLTVTPVEPPAPKYTVTAQGDPIYDNGVNADGITTLTVHSGVSGFKYFGVTIMPVTEHEGDERWYLFT